MPNYRAVLIFLDGCVSSFVTDDRTDLHQRIWKELECPFIPGKAPVKGFVAVTRDSRGMDRLEELDLDAFRLPAPVLPQREPLTVEPFVRVDQRQAGGTSLQGYTGEKRTVLEITAVFGSGEVETDKVRYEWVFEDRSGRTFSVYDYKSNFGPTYPFSWHIGARSSEGVEAFRQWFLEKVRPASIRDDGHDDQQTN